MTRKNKILLAIFIVALSIVTLISFINVKNNAAEGMMALTITPSLESGTYDGEQNLTFTLGGPEDDIVDFSVYYTYEENGDAIGIEYDGTPIKITKTTKIAYWFDQKAQTDSTYHGSYPILIIRIRIASPVITQSASFSGTQTVTISTQENCSVYYTVDGTEPTKFNGTKYTEPFVISDTATVKAIAVSASGEYEISTAAASTFERVEPQETSKLWILWMCLGILGLVIAAVLIYIFVIKRNKKLIKTEPAKVLPEEVKADITIEADKVEATDANVVNNTEKEGE